MHALHLMGTDFPFPAASGTVRGAALGTLPKLPGRIFCGAKHPARTYQSPTKPLNQINDCHFHRSFDDLIQINGGDSKLAQHIADQRRITRQLNRYSRSHRADPTRGTNEG